MLEDYLNRIGLHSPRDSAQQFQITLVRQWVEHLDYVLQLEKLPYDVHRRILYSVIYGAAPTLAESEIRDQQVLEAREHLKRTAKGLGLLCLHGGNVSYELLLSTIAYRELRPTEKSSMKSAMRLRALSALPER